MNYISRLQSENRELRAKLAAVDRLITDFRVELSGEKFRGVDRDGDRKDWMSVRDIDMRLLVILNEVR